MMTSLDRLLKAMIAGLLWVPGFMIAPILFAYADNAQTAGFLAGMVFSWANSILILLSIALLLLCWLSQAAKSFLLLAGLLLLAIVLNEFAVSPILQDLKTAMGPIDAVPMDHPLRQRFGLWHGVSASLHLFASLLAFALLWKQTGEQRS